MLKNHRFVVFLFVFLVLAISAPALFAQDDNKDVYGRALPDDAAPYSMQVYQNLCDSTLTQKSFSAVVTVYNRICGADHFSVALVNLDQNFGLIPAAADSWEVGADGVTWTFHLMPGQMWSDGTPLTANDWVQSWRYMATPASAYDFVWMWQGIIKNWSEAVAGEVPPDQIGMVAVDDNTLNIITDGPKPFLPATMLFWPPMQAKALAAIGPDYINDPATSVSSGPYILKEFVPGDHVVLDANPSFTGRVKPQLREIRYQYGDALNGSFLAFQNYSIDQVHYDLLSPADFQVITSTPELIQHYLPNPGDFRTDYLLMDTYNPPFDNHDVRLAFAKAVDRESIVANVENASFQVAVPAYSFLAPGYPAWDSSHEFKDIQAYDCPKAKELLAGAGYPNGTGFPELQLELRGESDAHIQWFTAVAASISDCLGVTITTNNMEQGAYMAGLNAKPTTIQFGAISYGMDYTDPANMMGVWKSSGRHSWRNSQFDDLVTQADSFVGDQTQRFAMYHQAEGILVQDVGGIFIDHRIQGDLFQPYLAGACFAPNSQGVSAWQWGNDWCWASVYITKDVSNYQTYRTTP